MLYGNVEQLSGNGCAVKLIIDEWILLWDQTPCTAALRVLNFVLLVSCDIDQGMTRMDLENPDPAATLADLQETWETSGKNEQLLSAKNKSKASKIMKKNFREWWNRWGTLMATDEQAVRQIIGWLMTMSSSGYRPLRYAATIACFSALKGCCLSCANLAKELDQASKLAKSKSLAKGSEYVDALGSELATNEKVIQMIFDAVFVQRFRDVDHCIRMEVLESLAGWIEAYPEVFLDNAYFRYIGWALSDRIAAVRVMGLEMFGRIYRIGVLREGMIVFKERFVQRIIDMASRDVDLSVRNEACNLMLLLHRYEDDQEEFRGKLEFLIDIVRFAMPITRETLGAIKMIIFEDDDEPDVDRDHYGAKFSESRNFVIATYLTKFMNKVLCPSMPRDRFSLIVEHFVNNAKCDLPILRDVTTWIEFINVILDPKECPNELHDQELVEKAFLLLQAVTRYGFVFVNSVADSSRQMIKGICRSHSKDLADLLVPVLPQWILSLSKMDGVVLAPLFDLVAMADGNHLLDQWTDGLETIEGLSHYSANRLDGGAYINLVRYWEQARINGIDGVMNRIIVADVSASLTWTKASNMANMKWDKLIKAGWWSRLAALATYRDLSGIGAEQLSNFTFKAISFIQELDGEYQRKILDAELIPDLCTIIANVGETVFINTFSQPEVYSVKSPGSSAAILKLLLDLAKDITSIVIPRRTEQAIIDFVLNVVTIENGLYSGTLFDLARLYLITEALSDDAIVAIFKVFDNYSDGVGLKCFTALWDSLVDKKHDESLRLVKLILVNTAQAEMSTAAALAKMLAEGIKKHPANIRSDLLVELHSDVLNRCNDDIRIEELLTPYASLLSPNLASEQLSVVRKMAPTASEYIKALEKASVKRAATPRRGSAIKQPSASRLREEVTSLADTEIESQAPIDNFMRDTPVKEMEGLKMSSETAMPSSPLQTRKRTIRL